MSATTRYEGTPRQIAEQLTIDVLASKAQGLGPKGRAALAELERRDWLRAATVRSMREFRLTMHLASFIQPSSAHQFSIHDVGSTA